MAAAAARPAPGGRYWVVEGEAYDLSGFAHPGGLELLLWSSHPSCRSNRDITIAVNTYHKNPKVQKKILERYKVQFPKDAVKRFMGVPRFLVKADFDAARDVPTYDFGGDDLLSDIQAKVQDPAFQREVRRMDDLFDLTATALVGTYLALLAGWCGGAVPWQVAVPAFVALRTAIAGSGHYFIHRKKPHYGDVAFDVNYVGVCYTAQDGHVLLHHGYTLSDADVKRGFFGGMLGVPRLLRLPVHSLHKLAHLLTGTIVRGIDLELEPDNEEHQGVAKHLRQTQKRACHWHFFALHFWLRIELLMALKTGHGWSWLAQFLCTVWINTCLVVSSHDFTATREPETRDWAKYQLANAHDISITGNRWVDVWLSAGLSPHRAHHLLPYQKSGYANVFSEQLIRACVEKRGGEWKQPLGFATEIFPMVFKRNFAVPACDPVTQLPLYADGAWLEEHLSASSLKYCAYYILTGFIGLGSI
ncbi:hypothetical protein M885DRAFT_578661 [Pelagophyceae sp. CCMP2097]|nr:hypothetical protein M885DRAFT_578661 [Pelagophyceae sp. CCMP2097]